MKALVIKPAEQSIEPVEIGSMEEIVQLIGFDTVIADDVGKDGDKLYFDEDCFLRGNKDKFQIDTVIPVSGTGVLIGSDGNDGLTDLKAEIEDIRSRTKFI
jgi:hypothetical protein